MLTLDEVHARAVDGDRKLRVIGGTYGVLVRRPRP